MKTGLLKKKSPVKRWELIELQDVIKHNENVDLNYLMYKERHFFFDEAASKKLKLFSNKTTLEAEEILKGRLKYFFCDYYNFNGNEDWLKSPLNNVIIDSSEHWSQTQTLDPNIGDIKFIWEPSRFAWVYVLCRAFVCSGKEKYAEKFWQLFENWLQVNQPNSKPNFACGQECAIRLFALCFAFFTLRKSVSTSLTRLLNLYKAIAVHASRIVSNIDFAISTRTNHSISEAAGIYTAGLLFPEMKNADKWFRIGKKILTDEGLRQINEDGTYIQHSTNYHRLMLQNYIWVLRLAENNEDKFDVKLVKRLNKAVEFLYQLEDEESGRVPNYGPNDGALVIPLNNCDFLDYRPVIQAGWYLFNKEKLYEYGDWDEDLLWLFGDYALSGKKVILEKRSTSFGKGGYYTFRNNNSWGMIRCHSYNSRMTQIDPMHFDFWAEGVNLLRDTGSYKYYVPENVKFEDYFKSIYAHNTVTIEDVSPVDKISRFSFYPTLKTELIKYENKGNGFVFKGINFAYYRNPWRVLHLRKIVSNMNRWQIIDEFKTCSNHSVFLRWHIPIETEIILMENKKIKLRFQNNWFLEARGTNKCQFNIYEGSIEGGLESLYYGKLSKIKTLCMEMKIGKPSIFNTIIFKDEI